MKTPNRFFPKRARRTQRRAAILVIGGMFTVSACLLCGLVVDTGNLCVARAELQRCSDSASLAAASVLLDRGALNGSPNPSAVNAAASTAASSFVRANPCRSRTLNLRAEDLFLTRYKHNDDPALCEFISGSNIYNSARVIARRDNLQNGPIPLFFGGFAGLGSVNANGQAAAFIETDISGFCVKPGTGMTCKLLPFSLWEGLWDARVAKRVDAFTHNLDTATVSNGTDGIYEVNMYPQDLVDCPGNFGTIDIGSANNSTADITRQILYGPNEYDFSFFPNNELRIAEVDPEEPLGRKILRLNGDTGISAAIKDDLYAIRGQPRILPLHWKAVGNGNNAEFRIVRFVGVTIVDVKLTGALKSKYVKIQPCYTVDGTGIGGGADGVTSEYIYRPPRLRKLINGH